MSTNPKDDPEAVDRPTKFWETKKSTGPFSFKMVLVVEGHTGQIVRAQTKKIPVEQVPHGYDQISSVMQNLMPLAVWLTDTVCREGGSLIPMHPGTLVMTAPVRQTGDAYPDQEFWGDFNLYAYSTEDLSDCKTMAEQAIKVIQAMASKVAKMEYESSLSRRKIEDLLEAIKP